MPIDLLPPHRSHPTVGPPGAEANTTVVPSAFFDELLDAFDRPSSPNSALRKAAQRLDELSQQQ
jgi:hypothetical protein